MNLQLSSIRRRVYVLDNRLLCFVALLQFHALLAKLQAPPLNEIADMPDGLESATRGLRRMEAVLDRVPEQQVKGCPATDSRL